MTGISDFPCPVKSVLMGPKSICSNIARVSKNSLVSVTVKCELIPHHFYNYVTDLESFNVRNTFFYVTMLRNLDM